MPIEKTFKGILTGITLIATVLTAGCAAASQSDPASTHLGGVSEVGNGEMGTENQEAEDEEAIEERADSYAHYATGIINEMNQQPDAALEEFRKAALGDLSNVTLVSEVGRQLLQHKEPEKALDLFKQATALPHADGSLYALMGLAYAQLDKIDLAIKANQTALKKSPQSLLAYQNLVQILLQNGQTQDAIDLLDKAAQQRNPDADFLVGLAEITDDARDLMGAKADSVKPRIRDLLDRAAQMKPDDPVLMQQMADSYKNIGDLDKAAQIYVALQKRFPTLNSLREKLADIYLRTGNKKLATQQLESIIRDNPINARAYFFLGTLAADAKDYKKAEDYFEKTLLFDPDFEPAYRELAGIQITADQPSDALDTLEKARDRFPHSFWVEFFTALAYGRMKQYNEAIQHFTAAEVVAKATDTNSLNHLFYYQLGATYERNKEYALAEANFQKCLAQSPNFADAMNYLGYMWAEQGVKLDQARQLLEKAVKIEPDNAAFLDSLGWVLFKLNQPKEALGYLLKAISLSTEPDATLLDHLGDIYAGLKQPDKALEAWRKSVQIEPNAAIQKKLESPIKISEPAIKQP